MGNKVERGVVGSLAYPKAHGSVIEKKPLRPEGYPVVGLDIEADSETAQPFLMGVFSDSFSGVFELRSWDDCVNAMCRSGLEDSVNFFYNLQYDFEGMVRFLSHENGIRLLAGETIEVDGAYISYVPKKAFVIKIGKHIWRFFDLWQYYLTSLSKAVKKNLPGESKIKEDSASISVSEFLSNREYRERIENYCLQDSRLCKLLGDIIVQGANQFVNTKTFYSSAGVSEAYFRSNGFRVMRFPSFVMKAFMRTYKGGRFEMMKRGHFEGVTSIDKKSAYPHAMSVMPILDESATVKAVRDGVDYDSRYGAYRVEICVPDDWYIGPIAIKDKGILRYPVGCFTEWIDRVSIDLLDTLGLDYKVHEGVEIFQDTVGSLSPLIEPLFAMKEDKSNPPSLRYAAKINMNGGYGKMIQLVDDVLISEVKDITELDDINYADLIHTYDKWFKRIHSGNFKTGRLFAPYYGSYITSHTRSDMFTKALSLGMDSVVSMHTDSMQYMGKGVKSNGGLGEWEVEGDFEEATLDIVKPGVYSMTKGESRKIKSRGIGNVPCVYLPSYNVKRRYGLNRAVRRDWGNLNVIGPRVLNQSLNGDKKRVWSRDLMQSDFKGRKSVDSRPFLYPDNR